MLKKYGDLNKELVKALCDTLSQIKRDTINVSLSEIGHEEGTQKMLSMGFRLIKMLLLADYVIPDIHKVNKKLSKRTFVKCIKNLNKIQEDYSDLLENDKVYEVYELIVSIFQDMCGEPQESLLIVNCINRADDATINQVWNSINGE